MPVFPVLDNGTPVPLTLFAMGDIEDAKALTQYRGVYSPRSRSRGDGFTSPTSLEFTGIVFGNSYDQMVTRRDAVVTAFKRGPQWLKFYENGSAHTRMLRVGRLLNKSYSWEDQRGMRVIRLTANVELLNPFWQSLVEESATESLVEGANSFTVTNNGNALSYPQFEVTGSSITSISVAVAGRTVQWVDAATLGAGTLIIDCLLGQVTVDGGSSLAKVADGSLFPELDPGDNLVTVNVTGATGAEITTRHRHAWEL